MEFKSVLSKVFLWMFLGLLVTFGTGYYVSTQENMLYNIFSDGMYFVLVITEFILVIILSARVRKMNSMTAKIMFLLYSFVTGLTFSSIFIAFRMDSIIFVFLIAAILFGIFAFIGHFTKLDLTKIGTYLLMALFGIILCVIVNLFLNNDTLDLIISCISIVVFLGFTAYDIQKIKLLSYEYENTDNLAIIGALELYLDFINIFLDLLRIFGKSND